MRRWVLAALAAAWGMGACAHVEAPSGGPEDELPPAVLVTRPDSLAVVRGWDAPVVIVFSERVSERGVREAVDVSPRTSMVVAEHSGDEIRVRLRDGWQPNQIYHVRVRPPVQDLFGNPIREPVELVFSTGPAIPDTRASGVVRDPITGKPELDARVEAIRVADSLVYAVATDSSGAYRFRRVPEGEYLLRAYRDMNRNRALDEYEPRDSARVTLAAGDTVSQRLGILLPDSTAPKLAAVQARDSVLELRFDDYLPPDQDLPPARIQITGADGSFVPVTQMAVGALPGSDTARAATPPAGPARPGASGTPAAADTSVGPLPSQLLIAELSGTARLAPATEYRITIRGVTNVVGLTGDSELTYKTPEAPAEPDTVAPDTVAPDTVAPSPNRAATAAPADTAARVGQLHPGKPELQFIMAENSAVPGLLSGKKGLIVGVANRNSIAWACAEALAGSGMDLAFTYQGETMRDRVQKTVADLGDVPLYDVDVRDDQQIDALFADLRERWGRLDFLLHSVAYAPKDAMANPFWQTRREDFLASHDISAYSLIGLTRAALPLMTEGGSVVTMTYYGAEKVVPNYNVMGVAKAALEASVRYLAAELGEKNVRINAVSAGAVNTLAARGVAHFRELLKITADRSPLKRAVDVEEVGKATLFLASDLASGITGETIYVDAGFHITAG